MNTFTHQDTQALHAAVFTATIAAYDLLLIPLSQLRPSSRNVGVSGRAGELPPGAPTEPYVKISLHTALVVDRSALTLQVPMCK